MSRFLARLALSAGICVSFLAATSAAEPETAARPLPSEGQSKILAALNQSTEFDFQQWPLTDVASYFKQKHEIEILLDNKALSNAGVSTDTPISEALKKITLRSALKLLLGQLDLTYVVGDGYLLITSKAEAESKLSFKVYPVEDLVTLDSAFRPARPKPDERDDPSLQSEVINPSNFGGLGVGTARRDEAGDFPGLINMITSSVSPTTWDEVGGPGSITANPNSQAIAVSQTDEVHEEIVELLAALRRVRDEQLAAAKPLEPAPPEVTEKKTRPRVRAYRLMRGTATPTKSGWRPPVQLVGGAGPLGNVQASVKPKDEPKPSGDSAAGKDAPPVAGAKSNEAAPVKPRDDTLAALAEKMATVVPELIEPGSWQPSGEGMIRAVGEGVVVRHTDEVQRRVATLMAELLPDCVPLGFNGPWGPWNVALPPGIATVRLRPTGDWPQQAAPRPSGAEAVIHEALLEKCDVEFDQLPLVDAVRPLAKPHLVQVYIDHKALTDAGVGTDTPVTCSVKGLSYKAALKLLLDELDLTYLLRNEVLLITSKTEAENMLTTKVYPVFDLVIRPPHAPANRTGLDFESLINNITTNIAPTTWDEVGGPGAIQSFTNSAALVISQTTEVHEEIAEYLKALRDVGTAQKQERADAS
jgi:hypothetical protein